MDGYTFAMLRNANADLQAADETIRRQRVDLAIAHTRIQSLEAGARPTVELEREISALRRQILDLRIEAAQHRDIRDRALAELARHDPSNKLLQPDVQRDLESEVFKRILNE